MTFFVIFHWYLSEDSYSVQVEMENEDVELQIADTAGEVGLYTQRAKDWVQIWVSSPTLC